MLVDRQKEYPREDLHGSNNFCRHNYSSGWCLSVQESNSAMERKP